MQVVTAMLCDFANVREGLLNVLSGGITRLFRSELPAALGMSVALVIDLHPTETSAPHEFVVTVLGEDGQQVVEARGTFGVQSGSTEVGEHAVVPVALDLRQAPVNRYGGHSVEILIDGEHRRSLQFWVLPAQTGTEA